MKEKLMLGVVMDPLHSIQAEKDTTIALLLEAWRQGFELYYFELPHLFLRYGHAWGYSHPLIPITEAPFFKLGSPVMRPLDDFDVLWMRKDPPVTLTYLYATYILEQAEQNGCLVINKPQALRDANEKLFTAWFPQCIPPTLVSALPHLLRDFIEEQGVAILKPLDGLGGQRIFKCSVDDPNLNVIISSLTESGTHPVMAQYYIPEIVEGDKRILLVNGEPIPYALARMPAPNDFRGNLAQGATGVGVELSDRDWWICAQIGPLLREKGLFFVGIDIIGEYLTEINVTSPTCLREIEKASGLNIAEQVLETMFEQLQIK